MLDYNELRTFELRNALQNGEIELEDLTDDQLEMLEIEEAEEERAQYAAAYQSYVSEWT